MKSGDFSMLPIILGLFGSHILSAYPHGTIALPTISGYGLSRPTTGGYNPPEPIYIQITNVVSPQVTSNSNAVSNANSGSGLPGSIGSGTTDLRGLLLLSGTQLVPYQGSLKDVKVVYIPVLVPVNATSPPGSSLTPSSTGAPVSPVCQPVQPSSSKLGNIVSAKSVMTTKKKAWTFPSK